MLPFLLKAMLPCFCCPPCHHGDACEDLTVADLRRAAPISKSPGPVLSPFLARYAAAHQARVSCMVTEAWCRKQSSLSGYLLQTGLCSACLQVA